MDFLAVVAAGAAGGVIPPTAEGGSEAGLTINLFWVLVSAINFLLLFAIVWTFAFKPLTRTLDDRKATIEQGLKDAEAFGECREDDREATDLAGGVRIAADRAGRQAAQVADADAGADDAEGRKACADEFHSGCSSYSPKSRLGIIGTGWMG